MSTRIVISQQGLREIASSVALLEQLHEPVRVIRDEAVAIAPVDEDEDIHYRDMIVGEVGESEDGRAIGRINAFKYTSGWIEFGTSHTPTFAVLRRAGEAVGRVTKTRR